MKYLSYELIAAANGWVDLTPEQMKGAQRLLEKRWKDYFDELDSLRPRLSYRAWKFFRHDGGPTGLHDGRLLSLTVGDGLDYKTDSRTPFRINHQKLSACLEFLNFEQDFHYTFGFRGISRTQCDLSPYGPAIRGVGDLYTYELVSIDDDYLQSGWIFASGASITIQFRKLIFRRRRIRRK